MLEVYQLTITECYVMPQVLLYISDDEIVDCLDPDCEQCHQDGE